MGPKTGVKHIVSSKLANISMQNANIRFFIEYGDLDSAEVSCFTSTGEIPSDSFGYYGVKIKTGSISVTGISALPKNSTVTKIVCRIPKNIKPSLSIHRGEVILVGDLKKINLDLNSVNLTTNDIEEVDLLSRYSKVTFGKIGNGNFILINNDSVYCQSADKVSMDAHYSSIIIDTVNIVTGRSVLSNVVLGVVKSYNLSNQYGGLKISVLIRKFRSDGHQMSFLEIADIRPSVDSVQVFQRYSNLSLGLRDVENMRLVICGTKIEPAIYRKKATTDSCFNYSSGTGKTIFDIHCPMGKITLKD